MKFGLRPLMFRAWYYYVSKIDKDAEILFMNYGFDDPKVKVELEPEYEKNRYSIQLYHRLANAVELKGKSLLEVGCGRGGGLAYVTKRFKPSSSLGIDLNKHASDFGNKHYKIDGLKFMPGDAQNLPLADNAFDVVLNVESSHRYPNFELFINEVKRVLKPNGYFLFTDFRYSKDLKATEELLNNCGLRVIESLRINDYVIEALNKDSKRREQLVEKLIPKPLHKSALNFAAAIGSKTYNEIKNSDYEYFLYVFKNDAAITES